MKKRKIFDMHLHLGRWNNNKNYTKADLDCFFCAIDKMVVSNLDCMYYDAILDEVEGNKKLLKQIDNDPRYVPLAVCRPDLTKGDTSALRKLLDDCPQKFKGLKIHPRAMNLPVDKNLELYTPYMELACKNSIPVLFHTEGEGMSGVEEIYLLAKMFPNVPVILAHMGAGCEASHNKAIRVFKNSLKNNDANIYVDLSWVDWQNGLPSTHKPSVTMVIKTALKYGAEDKILFGTDAPLGCFGERLEGGLSPKMAYDSAVKTLEDVIDYNFPNEAYDLKDKIFYDNAAKLYGI